MRDWRAYARERLRLPDLPPEREAEAIDEVASQLEDAAASAMYAGASEEDAYAIAERHIGDWSTLAADIANEDRMRPLPIERRLAAQIDLGPSPTLWQRLTSGLASDLLYGLRILRLNPGFAAIAVLTLAAGIGTSGALFGIVESVLLRPLPFRDSDRLVRLISLRATGEAGGISYPDFLDWRARSHAFDGMAVYTPRNFVIRDGNAINQVRGAVVSKDLFTILGASAIVGRTFVPAEHDSGQPTTVVLGYAPWRDRFGSDPQIVGRTIELDHRPATVVGVMPADFGFPIEPDPIELWTTMAVDNRDAKGLGAQRGVHYLNGIARLASRASIEQAQAELGSIVSALNREHPENDPRGVLVRPELAELVADVRSVWLALFGAAACLLLIGCTNVVNMLLARAASRRKELAVRFALGAGRGRLVRQLLTEHAMLGALGGASGLVFARWCIAILKQAAPPGVPRLQAAGLDVGVLLFTVGVSLGAVVLFGVMPALHASGKEPARLASLGGRDHGDESGGRIRRFLVVVQIALAMVLLVGGALLMRTVVRLQRVDPGFLPAHLVTFRIDLPDEYPAARERFFYQELLERVRAIPGVQAASAAYAMPFSGRDLTTGTEIEGRPVTPGAHDEAIFNTIQPALFHTLGVTLLDGRDFTPTDNLTGQPVAIVNEAFVRRFFGGVRPIGRHIKPGIANGYDKEPVREIVGVAPDIRVSSLRISPEPQVYVPAAQCPSIGNTMVIVRTVLDQQDVARVAKRVVASVDPAVPVSRVKTIEQYIFSSVVQPRFGSLLLGLFAAISSALAGLGLYGLLSYAVAQRTREIGVRLALGAAPRSVLAMILRQGAATSLAGIGVGVLSALVLTDWMTSLLFGVGPRDPATFLWVAGLLFFIALLACAIPAARAMRVDPIVALRGE